MTFADLMSMYGYANTYHRSVGTFGGHFPHATLTETFVLLANDLASQIDAAHYWQWRRNR